METKLDTVGEKVAYIQILNDKGEITDTVCIDHLDELKFQAKLDAKIAGIKARNANIEAIKIKVQTLLNKANSDLAKETLP